ncbi:MAG TPA: hypothetical protein VJ755_11785 [Gemmatimonadales bacterium]|nr:hypothetical protein [Gemmatimonadales bacterium]
MASTFKRAVAANVGATPVTVLTAPASKVLTLIDVSCANVEAAAAEVLGTVHTVAGGVTARLIKDGPIPAGGAMVVVGAPRKVVMIATDTLVATCDTANGMDVTVSYLEQDA